MNTIFRGSAALVTVVFLSSCNHWFYQPEREPYVTLEQLEPIRASERFLAEPVSGNKLHVWMLLPSETLDGADWYRPQSFGTVVQFHGNAENLTSHITYSYWLTYFGFNVISFDYSGYGQSAGEPSRDQTIRDGVALLGEVTEQTEEPLFVLGQSLGGAVAVAALARLDAERQAALQKVTGLIIDSSFASYRGVARELIASRWFTWPFQYPLSLTISRDHDPAGYAPQLTMPTRMFHSEGDPIVAFAEGQRLYDALGASDKALIRLKGRNHTAAFAYGPQPTKRALVEFLCQMLGAKTEACLAHMERVNTACVGEGARHCRLDAID